MSGPTRRFDPSELVTPGEPGPPAAEQADAMLLARDLEGLAANDLIRPTDGFEDRVMAAIAAEPAPKLVVRPASAVRGGRLGAFLIAVRESWGVASTGGRPTAVRAQALAFVLLVVLAVGTMTTVAAVGVGSFLSNRGLGPTDATPSNLPVATETPESSEGPERSGSPEASESAEPSETAEPGETPEASEAAEPGETQKAGETPRATRTPRPTRTPKPNETAEPSETPEASDDHGGASSGSGSSRPS
jgi:hypothetical protein